jgi:hypothetical protein
MENNYGIAKRALNRHMIAVEIAEQAMLAVFSLAIIAKQAARFVIATR